MDLIALNTGLLKAGVYNTGIDFGPLGEEAIPKIGMKRIWSKVYWHGHLKQT